MHVNHRRKIKYRCARGRWYTDLGPWKRNYWQRERARERHLLAHERYDDCQDKHPRNILWDAL
jgi:hypothetical protein